MGCSFKKGASDGSALLAGTTVSGVDARRAVRYALRGKPSDYSDSGLGGVMSHASFSACSVCCFSVRACVCACSGQMSGLVDALLCWF